MASSGITAQPPLLKRLNPTLRLGVVFTLDVVYIFINNLPGAAAILLVGLVIYFASCGRNKKLALAALFPGLMLLVYNSILSPHQPGSLHWWIFTINLAGVERGLVTGMRLVGVMLVSFAWLLVTPVPEIYQGLDWLKPARAWILELLRGVQIVKREFIALTQSLIIRGLKWDSPLANIKNLVPLAMAIVPRVAERPKNNICPAVSPICKCRRDTTDRDRGERGHRALFAPPAGCPARFEPASRSRGIHLSGGSRSGREDQPDAADGRGNPAHYG